MKDSIIRTELINYYGEVAFVFYKGKYYMTLDNWDGMGYEEITKEMFDSAAKVFGAPKTPTKDDLAYRFPYFKNEEESE